MTKGTLYVVATPIGNLADLSPRARQVLAGVQLIAAEDTRHTGRLLSHFGLQTPQMALHEHNEEASVAALIARLRDGVSIALVSDAGTPLISDPGYRLVRAAHETGVPVSPLPGPSAALAALSIAGLPTDRFCFEGFLPPRQKARRDRLEALRSEARTMIFYASVHAVGPVVDDLVHAFGAAREAFLGRELTKLHEQCVAAPLGELAAMLADGRIAAKGEFVLVVSGDPEAGRESGDALADRLLAELLKVLPGKQAVAIVADVTGMNRNSLYRKMLVMAQRDRD